MRRAICVASLALTCAALGGPAMAAATHHFDIPAKAVNEALIDFAIQADISIGGNERCQGTSRPVVGDLTVEAGLTRMLAGGACRFQIMSPDTVRIVETARPQPVAKTAAAMWRSPGDGPLERSVSPALAEVIVTATRRPALAARLADSISVVGAEALKTAGATDAGDIASGLAGVTTTNLGPGRDKILLRGLSDGVFTGRTESTVGIYLDNTPVTFNAPDPDLRLTDVQAVELLRGPQGFLYGAGSLSGVYRIVTQRPVLNQWSGSLRAGGGLTDGGAPSGEFDTVLNLPLARDKAALRLVAYGEIDGGYITNVALRKSNIDGTQRTGGRVALRILPAPNWAVTLGLTGQLILTNDTQYVTPSLGRLHVANQIDESSTNTFAQANLTIEHDGAWGGVRSTTAVTHHTLFSQTDASMALPLFGVTAARVGAFNEPATITMVTEDAAVTSPNSGRLQWLAGGFASVSVETTTPDVRTRGSILNPPQALYVEQRTDRLGELALYGQLSYGLTARVTLEAGLRASTTLVSTTSTVTAPQMAQSRRFSGAEQAQDISPKVAVKFQASENLMVYALASEGHRAGGFNTGGPIGTRFGAPGGPPAGFGADRLWNLEAGLKADMFDRRVSLRGAAFYDIWNNIQTDQFLPSGLSYTANAGDGRNYGAEVEASYFVTPRLRLGVSALINAPELVKAAPGFAASGHVSLPGVADFSAGATIAYERPLTDRLSLELSAQSQYVGHSYLTFNPVTSPRMGGYTLNRLSAQLKGRRWRLSAFVINPTNEAGNTFSYGNPFNFRQIAEVTPQRPRTIRMTLGVDF